MSREDVVLFHVGELVWLGRLVTENVVVPCPVCFGLKQVIMILGDNSQVFLDCGYCHNSGFGGATGQIVESTYAAGIAEKRMITGVDVRTSQDGLEVTYWFGGQGGHADMVAATEEEAITLAQIKASKQNQAQAKRREEDIKYHVHKSYTWNAGYHMREAREAEKRAAYHRRMAQKCEEKARK